AESVGRRTRSPEDVRKLDPAGHERWLELHCVTQMPNRLHGRTAASQGDAEAQRAKRVTRLQCHGPSKPCHRSVKPAPLKRTESGEMPDVEDLAAGDKKPCINLFGLVQPSFAMRLHRSAKLCLELRRAHAADN